MCTLYYIPPGNQCFFEKYYRKIPQNPAPEAGQGKALLIIAVLPGRTAALFLKVLRKVILILKTQLDGDILDAQSGVAKHELGGLQPLLIHVLIGRHAVGRPEAADGLGYGQIGDLAALFQGQLLVEMAIDVGFEHGDILGHLGLNLLRIQMVVQKLHHAQESNAAPIHAHIQLQRVVAYNVVDVSEHIVGIEPGQMDTGVQTVGIQNGQDQHALEVNPDLDPGILLRGIVLMGLAGPEQIGIAGLGMEGAGGGHNGAGAGEDVFDDGDIAGTGTGEGVGAVTIRGTYTFDGLTFGGLFAEATDFAAHVGSFSETEAPTYNLKAKVDYYQFYGTALTAAQVESLGSGATASADEMNATMPTLALKADTPKPIAAIDFDSTNGAIIYNTTSITAGTVELTDANVMDDALTLAEAQAMGKEYSVVFRYKSNVPSGRANLPLLYMAGTKTGGFSAQKNKLLMGMPGTSNIYFQAYANGSNVSSLSGATTNFGDLLSAMNDGQWHTVALVQSASGLIYYVDGTAYPVTTNSGAAVVLNQTIGSMFTNVTADQLDAVFGRYGMTDTNWKTQGSFDFYQLYSTALSAAQVQELSGDEEVTGPNWSAIDHDNAVWAVAGDDNIAYYGGTVANRSLLRFIDNTARNCNGWTNRDIRILPFANNSYDPVYLANNFDSVFGGHSYSLFMLIPSMSSASVADYKAAVKTLMEKNKDKVRVLWTPLASGDATENANISLYAEAVREIAAADNTILFFDANKFMNEKMEGNATLKRNWFEVNGISPLCALDLTRAFYTHAGVAAFTQSEIKNHDLRLSSDTRARKTVVRDYIAPTVTASGSSITVDASALTAAYSGMTNLRVLVMPEVGFGTFSEVNWTKSFGNATTVTFDAPWANPVVTVLGDLNGYTYRFKDIPVAAAAGNPGVDYATDALTALEVVGAPAIGFSADKTSYNVTLYQYQRNVQIRAQGGKNLSVTVNGQNVGVG